MPACSRRPGSPAAPTNRPGPVAPTPCPGRGRPTASWAGACWGPAPERWRSTWCLRVPAARERRTTRPSAVSWPAPGVGSPSPPRCWSRRTAAGPAASPWCCRSSSWRRSADGRRWGSATAWRPCPASPCAIRRPTPAVYCGTRGWRARRDYPPPCCDWPGCPPASRIGAPASMSTDRRAASAAYPPGRCSIPSAGATSHCEPGCKMPWWWSVQWRGGGTPPPLGPSPAWSCWPPPAPTPCRATACCPGQKPTCAGPCWRCCPCWWPVAWPWRAAPWSGGSGWWEQPWRCSCWRRCWRCS